MGYPKGTSIIDNQYNLPFLSSVPMFTILRSAPLNQMQG